MSITNTQEPAHDLAPKSKKRRNRKKIITVMSILLILICLSAASYAAYKMLLGPSDGIVVNSISDNHVKSVSAPELEQFDGSYVYFAHPATFVLQPPSKDDVNNLETHTFIASGMMNKILTVIVTKLPSAKLEDDSSYLMRNLHPETYKLSAQTVQGEKVVVALNSKDAQQAAFWVHGGKLLTFTISSVTINSQETAQEYQKMLESVRWR